MKAMEALQLGELKESDMEMGDCSSEDTKDDDQELAADLKKALQIKDKDKGKEKGQKPHKKESAWEVASKVGDNESVGNIKTKLFQFKTELGKDVANVEQKIHELKQSCPKEKTLLKDSLKTVEAAKKSHGKLDKMTKSKFSKHEAASQLQEAHKALAALKASKARLLKALKA